VPAISLLLGANDSRLGTDGYRLSVTSGAVTVRANRPAGLFAGTRTLLQLLPTEIDSPTVVRRAWIVPGGDIVDYPRFAYRGAMLDEARHFHTPDEIKAYVDEISRFKVNHLHLHLSDDQGWRIQIGTLEFLLDPGGEFYFMEMNTRLQVEHPVTEAITGLDLVELQLRIAAGEPLGLRQEDIKFSGHAIEVRLCSEDANHDFMPQSGKMALWQMPDGVRVEHALQSGSEIPPFYDSMIAKIISHGADRNEARGRLICGLEQTAAFGVTTNQGFLISCLRHPGFAKGEATTAFIGSHRDELLAPRANEKAEAALAALLLYVTNPHAPPWRSGRSLAATFPLTARIDLGQGVHEVDIVRERDGRYVAGLENGEQHFEIDELGPDAIRFRTDGMMESARFLRDGDRLYVLHRGVTIAARDLTLAAPESAAAAGGDGKVRAAMNGRVVALLVKPGEQVAVGQPVMTLEAMKMEHVHTAGVAGTVSSIDVAEGEQVTTGRIVVEIQAA
jgi:geranyl-CoA carboxylase alpha subunit